MFPTKGLTPSQASAVRKFETQLNLCSAQPWVAEPSHISFCSGASSFVRLIQVNDLQPGCWWSSLHVASTLNLTSVDGLFDITLSELTSIHSFEAELPLRMWIVQAADLLLSARYSFVWCERGLDGPSGTVSSEHLRLSNVPFERLQFSNVSSCPNPLQRSSPEGSIFNWEETSSAHTPAVSSLFNSF